MDTSVFQSEPDSTRQPWSRPHDLTCAPMVCGRALLRAVVIPGAIKTTTVKKPA